MSKKVDKNQNVKEISIDFSSIFLRNLDIIQRMLMKIKYIKRSILTLYYINPCFNLMWSAYPSRVSIQSALSALPEQSIDERA